MEAPLLLKQQLYIARSVLSHAWCYHCGAANDNEENLQLNKSSGHEGHPIMQYTYASMRIF